MTFNIFISSSWEDMHVVNELKKILKRYGIQPIPSWEIIGPGDLIVDKIKEQIQLSDCVLVIIGKGGGRSENVAFEIGIATGLNKLVIPIIEEGAEVPKALINKQYILIDRNKPELSYNRAAEYLNKLRIEKERRDGIGGLLLLGLGLLLLAALASEN